MGALWAPAEARATDNQMELNGSLWSPLEPSGAMEDQQATYGNLWMLGELPLHPIESRESSLNVLYNVICIDYIT